jgi:hypothetical protein
VVGVEVTSRWRETDSFHLVTRVHLLENVCRTNINTGFSPSLLFVAEFI